MQEVSGPYTFPILDTDEIKIALRARKKAPKLGTRNNATNHNVIQKGLHFKYKVKVP